MLYIKMMSSEDLPDDDPHKNFILLTAGDKDIVSFGVLNKNEGEPEPETEYNTNTVFITRYGEPAFESYPMKGNVYIMNQNGKTIASRGLKSLVVKTA